jgi:hypothetical protein
MLELVESPSPQLPVFDPPPFQLRPGAARPGVGHTAIPFEVPTDLGDRLFGIAGAAGVPLELSVALMIESERALGLVHPDRSTDELERELDRISAAALPPIPGGSTRLAAYARALRRGGCGAVKSYGRQLTLPVPHHTSTSWRRSAAVGQETMDRWMARLASTAGKRRHLWEASSAESGMTLAEWVLAQAARRCSR